MELCDELSEEHRLIERVAGGFLTFAKRLAAGEVGVEDGPRFFAFFARWANDHHHAREEDVLFVALARECELPTDRGPVAALTTQHCEMGATLGRARGLLEGFIASPEAASAEARQAFAETVRDYVLTLWAHIDAEDSVLIPESAERLRRQNVFELPMRSPSAEELAARDDGEALCALYPMPEDAHATRGEQCVICPSFGKDCRGVELEWWNESEWEEFPSRVP